MKRYRFALETVLRARRAQEDLARQNLSLANRRLRDTQQVLVSERARYRAMGVPAGVVDADAARADWSTQHLAAASVAYASRRFEDQAVLAADLQAAWREVARRVAALERLDDRRRAEHRLAAGRAETGEIDDLVTARFLSPGAAGLDGGIEA